MAKKRDIYEVDGERVPGVTTITGILDKPALMFWAVRMAIEHIEPRWEADKIYSKEYIQAILDDARRAHQVKKDKAADIGTNVHEIVETYIKGQLKPEHINDEKEKRALENFIITTEGWTWFDSEIVVINKELRYGGTSDGLAMLPSGEVILPDVKTGSGVYPEHNLQLAMYALAEPREEKWRSKWKEITEGRILHFNKERLTWEVLERSLKAHYPFIPHLRQMYEWTRVHNPKKYY